MLNIVVLSKFYLKKFKGNKLALILIIAVVFASFSQSSIGIGTVTPHISAILDVNSTTKGFLPPRINKIQMKAINNPTEGLIVYCSDCSPKGIYVFNGIGFSWQLLFFKPPSVEYLNIDDVRIDRGTTSFVISPTLIPSEATVDYELIRKPTEVTIEETTEEIRINIAANIPLGEYNITVKATGNEGYSGETGATFKLNVVPPPTKASCFRFSSETETITDYICSDRNVIIPASIDGITVTRIGNDAFRNNYLRSVYIPNSVTSIGNNAFRFNGLSSVYIGDSVKYLGYAAFAKNNLSSVTIPDSMTHIEDFAFYNNKLTSVTIPDSVTHIGISAFRDNNLRSVYISASVTHISIATFFVNNLSSVYIPDSVTSIGGYAFRENNLSSVSIKSGTKYFTSRGSKSFDSSCTVANGCITLRP